jgi:hypothetical protein
VTRLLSYFKKVPVNMMDSVDIAGHGWKNTKLYRRDF